MEEEAGPTQPYSLTQGHELRIEVGDNNTVYLTLRQGRAEVFGTELSLGQKVALTGQKVAVYTWYGCRLDIQGKADVMYEADETPMVSYLNAHGVLEERREAAKKCGGDGPRVVVVGTTDCGKSTLCKVLCNYAVRKNWCPTMVDLDVGQGSIACPGSIGATPVDTPIDVEEGLPLEVPLVFFFGAVTPSENPELYKYLVGRLAAVLERRAAASPEARAAGMMINTMGWVEELGYELLLHSITTLRADVVLVVGQERLYSQLRQHLGPAATGTSGGVVQVVKLPKSGGVVTRTPPLRKAARTGRVREYFYGQKGDLQPHSSTVPFSQLHVYRVGGGPRAPSSALPIGAQSVSDPLRVAPVVITSELLHSVLAVSHASEIDEVLPLNIAGYVYVTDVDVARSTITYLAPCPGPLPGKFLLAGSLKVFLD